MSISIRKTAAAVLVAGTVAVPVLSTASASASVAHPQLTSAARSVQAFVTNRTGCMLNLVSDSLSHGIWTTTPPFQIPNGTAGTWESESDGFMTGTEGTATYRLTNCADPRQNLKFAAFHWDNPYVGSNSYDNVGTTQGVNIARQGGSGDNAVVSWFVTTS